MPASRLTAAIALGLVGAGRGLDLSVSLHTSWPAAPLPAELLEGLAELGRGAAYLRALASKAREGATSGDGAAWLQVAAEVAGEQLSFGTSSLYGNFLSLQARLSFSSPSVEAARNLEMKDRATLASSLQGCSVGSAWAVMRVADLGSAALCGSDVAQLSSLAAEPSKLAASGGAKAAALQRTSLDHVLYEVPADSGQPPVEVLGYLDLGDEKAVASLLKVLVNVADALHGRPGWVAMRHGSPSVKMPGLVPGFGVELHLRSTDEVTKSVDGEAPASAEVQTGNVSACFSGRHSSDPAELTHGLDLSVLAQRHPQATGALCALQKDLHAAVEPTPPPWELKRVSGRAALRVVRDAKASGGLKALATLQEVAQDFPSGWAYVLQAGGEDEETARKLIRDADPLPPNGRMTMNGWVVHRSRRTLLPLLRTYAPMLQAIEVLGSAGFEGRGAAEILRMLLPPAQLAKRIVTADPRLPENFQMLKGLNSKAAMVYNVQTDRRTANWDSSREVLYGFARNFGRFWQYPPPVRRPLVGVELVLDPCDTKLLKLPAMVAREAAPLMVWVTMTGTPSPNSEEMSTSQSIAGLMQSGLRALVNADADAEDIQRFVTGYDGGCASNAEDLLTKHWKTHWKSVFRDDAAPPLTIDRTSSSAATLPAPSAVVNGRVVTLLNNLQQAAGRVEALCKEEVHQLHADIRWGRLAVDNYDRGVALWQYLGSESAASHIWHPVISAGSHTKVLPQEVLRELPGGSFMRGGAVPAVHVLILSDPGHEAAEGPLATPTRFLSAMAEHVIEALPAVTEAEGQVLPPKPFIWLGVAVSGKCPSVDQPLTLSGAVRRCLAASLSTVGPMHLSSAGSAGSLSKRLKSVAAAFAATTEAAGSRTGGALVETLLKKCEAEASSGGSSKWASPDIIRASSGKVNEDDVARCRAQRTVAGFFDALPADSAYLVVNGQSFGPIQAIESGMPIAPAHIALAEGIALRSMPLLADTIAKRFPDDGWPPGQKRWPSLSLVKALSASLPDSSKIDFLDVAWALAVLIRSIEEVQAARSAGDDQSAQSDFYSRSRDVEEAFEKAGDNSKFELLPKEAACPFHIHIVLDPLSEDTARMLPVLRVLHEELNAWVSIAFRPEEVASMPINAYRRFAELPPAAAGLASLGRMNLTASPVVFSLPPRPGFLMSMRMDTPEAWLCSAVDSGGLDLASIPGSAEGTLHVSYRLEALFVEGFAYRPATYGHEAAAGVQLELAPIQGGRLGEGGSSVVVKSGYFQLRGPPGLYDLALAGGSAAAAELAPPDRDVRLVDLAGYQALLKVYFKPASDAAKAAASSPTIADGTQDSYAGAGGDPAKCTETIHIFSVASGHRYERLLRIMLLSVRQHTSCPMRIWLVDNFLSPSFRKILPALGRKVGFAVSSVTYKWPAWLRPQTESQRVIWAYKVLFLDVLFPSQVHKVLFIDADQIVRADVREVWDTKMRGLAYGFVPFCGSSAYKSKVWSSGEDVDAARNPDTVGFRFWEQGFWKSHLGPSRHYYISALFLVDLDAFRKLGAGDMIRDIYQQLTRDPGSLANLDQDLLNYAQESIPIFTLPAEWLWCETWCSESVKSKAKTIDMCQNPVRKEGKLQQARRIAPEWTKYDALLDEYIAEVEISQDAS